MRRFWRPADGTPGDTTSPTRSARYCRHSSATVIAVEPANLVGHGIGAFGHLAEDAPSFLPRPYPATRANPCLPIV
jgi:hypothetical protein